MSYSPYGFVSGAGIFADYLQISVHADFVTWHAVQYVL